MTFARIGVVGAPTGLSRIQRQALTHALTRARATANDFHHRGITQADEQGARIAKSLGYRIVGHPPVRDAYQRDRELVDELVHDGALLGFPSPLEAADGSSTRHAVHYARYRWIPLLCVTPGGLVIDHYRVDAIYPLTRAANLITDLRSVDRPEGAA